MPEANREAIKLINIQMEPLANDPGFFSAWASIQLDRGPQRQPINFGLDFPHVRSSDDVQRELPERVKEFAKELSDASDRLQPPANASAAQAGTAPHAVGGAPLGAAPLGAGPLA